MRNVTLLRALTTRQGSQDPKAFIAAESRRPGAGRLIRASRAVLLGIALMQWPIAPAAAADDVAKAAHVVTRLIDAGPAPVEGGTAAGQFLVGIELRLDPKFITYWRNPGEAGVPPVFTFDASDNLGRADVAYPAPRVFDEGGIDAYGYEGSIIFPVLVAPRDPARPVTLDLVMDFAVCFQICLPVQAHLRGLLGHGAGEDAERVREALSRVPRARALGEAGAVRIDALTPVAEAEARVEAATPDGSGTLFVEAPDGWLFKASPAQKDGPGHVHFSLRRLDHPDGATNPVEPLRLTLVTPAGSIDVLARLNPR